MRSDIRTRVGDRVRALRTARGWTQEALAERASLSYKFVGDIERGRGNPSLATLEHLSEAFGVDVVELFGSAPDKTGGYFSLTRDDAIYVREALETAGSVLRRAWTRPRKPRKK